MPILVLMRHGSTLWGQENRFAGWGDTPLNEDGLTEAKNAARTLAKANFSFSSCYTSELLRARQTLSALVNSGLALPANTHFDWRLNERHYGALQGETRAVMIKKYGNNQVVEWRRSYTAIPPPLHENDPRWLEQLQRLPNLTSAEHPKTESMAIAADRVAPVWHTRIAPDLKNGKQVLVVAHTSSIRGLARAIEGLSDEASEDFRVATAIPVVYEFDDDLKVVNKSDLTDGLSGSIRYWTNQLKPRNLGWI
jgi:2,3-bisphosphoglycerate-dependent phosphoglycerate mutase